MQLEILSHALDIVLENAAPCGVLALSAVACTSTVMLLHINPMTEGQGCAPCAFLMLLGFSVCAWLGGFMNFRQLEQVSDESASVLSEISDQIIAEAMVSNCLYGRRLAGRSYVTRLFRQRILRVKIGEFRKLEPGFALEFFQTTADNVVTYIFMVNPSGQMELL